MATTAIVAAVMLAVGLYTGYKCTLEALRRHFPWTYMTLQAEVECIKARKKEKA